MLIERYFEVVRGEALDIAQKIASAYETYTFEIKKILTRIGASGYWRDGCGLLTSICFDNPDKKLYKRHDGGRYRWYPKLNTKFGKRLHKELGSLMLISPRAVLGPCGLLYFSISHYGVWYYPRAVILPRGEKSPVVVIKVPWLDDVKQDELEAYRYNVHVKKDGTAYSSTLESLTWEPAGFMAEIKQCEAMRIIEEHSEMVGVLNKQKANEQCRFRVTLQAKSPGDQRASNELS